AIGARIRGGVVDQYRRGGGETRWPGGCGSAVGAAVVPDGGRLVGFLVAGLVGRVVGDRVAAVVCVVGRRADRDAGAGGERAGVEIGGADVGTPGRGRRRVRR